MVRDRYGSKDELLAAMHREYEALLLTPRPGGERRSGLERLIDGIDRLRAFAAQRPTWLRALFVASFEDAGIDTPTRGLVKRWLDDLHAWGRAALQDGQRDGSVHDECDPGTAMAQTIREAIGDAYMWVIAPDSLDYDRRLVDWRDELITRYAAHG